VLTTGLRRDTRSVEVTVGAAPTAQDPTAQDPTAQDPTAQGPTAQGPTAQGPIAHAQSGWAELTVRTAEGDAFPGWWRRFGAFVLTVAAEQAFPAPASFDDPPLLAGAEPTHSWLRRPETAQPAPAIPRSRASMT